MGIIRAAVDTARGTLADQWLDVVEAGEMGEQTLFTEGVIVRQGSNRRGNSDVISNGSVIHVYDNQFMILTAERSLIIPLNRAIIPWTTVPPRLFSTEISWAMC